MPDPTPINVPRRPVPSAGTGDASPGINLTRDDIYFILFRHKWLIAFCAVLGVVASGLYYTLKPSVYGSEAKLLVRYVFDAKGTEGVGTDSQIKSPDSRGENIINSELEILTSLDLCEQVAGTMGPDSILRRPASTNDLRFAGAVLRSGLTAEIPKNSSVIKVGLQHRDPDVPARALGQLVEAYLRRHVEVHRAIGVFDSVLSQQSDQFRTRLAETERQLRLLKTNFVGVSIEDARKALTEQLSKIRLDLFAAEAQIADSIAVGRNLSSPSFTNLIPATNMNAGTNMASTDASPPPSAISEYRGLCSRLEALRTHELELRSQFKDENLLVKNVRQQILDTTVSKELLETEHPSLLRIEAAVSAVRAASGDPGNALEAERLRTAGLQARHAVLTNQLAQVKSELGVLDAIEGEVQRLQRTKELEEKNYRYYAAGIEQARFDEAVAGGKLANISIIQAPTPPIRENGKRMKITLGLLVGGLLGGIALAFLIEMFLDRSLKIPAHFEDRLHLPLFVSIPLLPWSAGILPATSPSRRLLGKAEGRKSRTGVPPVPQLPDSVPQLPGSSLETIQGSRDGLPSVWSVGHPLRPYFETLRDRVIFHFEGITRKPKLVGVTACGHGSGVTTTAVGLAASLSETGGGNVLLVDMNLEPSAAHPFFQGRPGCGLADAIETDRRETGLVSEHLYLAKGRNGMENGGNDCLPQRLSQFVPKLRVSDYDYIVFDMPLVTQTGVTARLSGMMDLVLMVAESGKDQKDVLERAVGLLNASGAKLGGVLNKVQSYVPRRLRSQFYEPAA